VVAVLVTLKPDSLLNVEIKIVAENKNLVKMGKYVMKIYNFYTTYSN